MFSYQRCTECYREDFFYTENHQGVNAETPNSEEVVIMSFPSFFFWDLPLDHLAIHHLMITKYKKTLLEYCLLKACIYMPRMQNYSQSWQKHWQQLYTCKTLCVMYILYMHIYSAINATQVYNTDSSYKIGIILSMYILHYKHTHANQYMVPLLISCTFEERVLEAFSANE